MKAHITNRNIEIDPGGYNKCISAIDNQWQSLSKKLIEQNIPTDNIDFLLLQPEFKWFFDMFNKSGCELYSVYLSQITTLYRFVYENNPSVISESRFIPQAQYAHLNRMNDEKILYQYFVTDYSSHELKGIQNTGVLELRAKNVNNVYYCLFSLKPQYKQLKIIDLRFAYDDVKDLYRDIANPDNLNTNKFRYLLMHLLIESFGKSKMFAPVDKSQPDSVLIKYYRPFHFIASYFEKMGYAGLLYHSTVSPSYTNLVLFNIDYCSCNFDTLTRLKK